MDEQYWHKLSLYDQLGNVGAEIGRTISWRLHPEYGDPQTSFVRGLDFLDLTISDPKHRGPKLKELCRVREALVDWYLGSSTYHTTDRDWDNYFMPFAIASNLQRAKITK